MRAIIVDTNVASFLFKGDTRANQYTPHLAGDTTKRLTDSLKLLTNSTARNRKAK